MTKEKIDPVHVLESLYLIYTHELHKIRLKLGKLSELKKCIDDIEKILEEKSNARIENVA